MIATAIYEKHVQSAVLEFNSSPTRAKNLLVKQSMRGSEQNSSRWSTKCVEGNRLRTLEGLRMAA
jgi:hypothetical protein